VHRFPDGETTVQLLETVRRKEVLLVQPTSPPVNDHLVELLAFIDTCHRSSAARITAIIPYFGYARADKRHGRREPVTASMVTMLLQAVGVDQVVTVDLHAPQIEGFFRVPVDNLTAVPPLCATLAEHLPPDTVIVSPDAGRVKMATRYAQHLNMPVAVLHKQRHNGTQTAVTHLVGDVEHHPCLIIDDMIATGGTLADSVNVLLDAGARPKMHIAATHGLLLEGARTNLTHEAISNVYVTDTMAQDRNRDWPHLHVVSIAPLIAEAIRRFLVHDQIRDLVS
jgi:ribose-phosphate pyrophosphokinase